ncbi:cation-transporting P-type ATPase [Arthrobacter sp. CAU 1506]|uniref:cation-translocating P-type ATPase n=1 Tax=Arthrobacter sp. CAU 1506 TaxID=2560052 RepID=UPI0010ABB9E1|nr:cation-transporting P-type ATPase [Arthrobacter sp. CAU 1506]TJY71457.1 cation-transporting P-type ATPase [Arthrobacter sp. CAU 1506]
MSLPETTETSAADQWHVQAPEAVVAKLGTNEQAGLDSAEADQRRARYGPNSIAAERPPSRWAIALRLLRDPMNLMLVGVVIVSLIIDQVAVAIIVALLVILNLVLGTQQELKARASVDALAKMQIPQARVVRNGSLAQLDATDLVPGDIVNLEAGDLVPADGRLLRSATLETQEAALTGESAPIAKDPKTLEAADVSLGDRTNMAFQNTAVTRGTATMVVTATGMQTEMGKIASMLSSVDPGKSPLQRELDGLTKVIGIIAWSAVAIIIIIGVIRGQAVGTVLLVGMSMAIAAIPTGMPTFVQAMLAYGAKQLAEHKAVVKNLSDVETLGATSAINSDKTGTLTMNQMMVRQLYVRGTWYSVQGEGYAKTGVIRQTAGEPVPDFTRLAYGLCLDSDATVSDSGEVIGDPTEAALVVLAAKMGVDAEHTRRAYPRIAEVPFDSAYKFMATFHNLPLDGEPHFVEMVKGGPDVVLARCSMALLPEGEVAIGDVQEDITKANASLSEKGLRVLAFAVRRLDGREAEVAQDPMKFVDELTFVGMVGIIDPLRSEAAAAVRTAHEAGIEVRMITGDHAVTAAAIGAELKLGAGAISGAEIQAMSDADLQRALPGLHVFGRVTPQDKLRLARLMQQGGAVVAMTGDAVNDAAALKQADVGVAMGSGSEVTKQAGNLILTDDNFGTLVTAIRLGRSIYDKIVSFVRYQMSALFALVLLFLVASVFNINDGVALSPTMVLFINFFITIFPVMVIMTDPPAPDLMSRPPRDTTQPITNGSAVTQWLVYGVVGFAVTFAALLLAPGPMSATEPNVPLTMAFVVLALSSVFGSLAKRRDPESGLVAPIINALKILSIPVLFTVAAVEIGFLQDLLLTTSLSGGQWLACIGLALIVPIVVELDKAIRRGQAHHRSTVEPARADGGELVVPATIT